MPPTLNRRGPLGKQDIGVGSLLPASDKEREAAQALQKKVKLLMDQAKEEVQRASGQQANDEVQLSSQQAKDTLRQGSGTS